MVSGVYNQEKTDELLVKAAGIASKQVFSNLRKALDKLEAEGSSS